MEAKDLHNFLEIPYDKLQELNTEAKKKMLKRAPVNEVRDFYIKYLKREKRLKAVTLCFSDIEGKFHMLDYDKVFFLKSYDNLTFDGSSIKGFSDLAHSDLRLTPDWLSFRWLPSDVFGPGKVLIFGLVTDQDGTPYKADIRSRLKLLLDEIYKKKKWEFSMAPEIEGFLLEGEDAEQKFDEKVGFKVVSEGGYYHSLPIDTLRQFIDRSAEAQRVLGFDNEKDHPEVAPSQFELNFSYSDALVACDEINLYKLVCRQVAHNMGMTACFLPKPIVGINGSGMHCNISVSKQGKNIFYDKKGESGISKLGWDFVSRILNHANDICLILNASVNAYRRLDPHFEAPNQIRYSATDRGAMIRLPLANEHSTRLEVRSIGPDVNPYLVAFTLLKAGLEGEKLEKDDEKRPRTRILPGTIIDSIRYFKSSEFVGKILGEDVKERYLERKLAVANRSAKELGVSIKNAEVLYHHEITNQVLWNKF